jgi:hypothetical protein
VANEGSSAMLLDKIPPIKTMMGEADITKGWATNNNQIFLGKLKNLVNTTAVINNSESVIKILINISNGVYFPV